MGKLVNLTPSLQRSRFVASLRDMLARVDDRILRACVEALEEGQCSTNSLRSSLADIIDDSLWPWDGGES